jgi:hypothetical protein
VKLAFQPFHCHSQLNLLQGVSKFIALIARGCLGWIETLSDNARAIQMHSIWLRSSEHSTTSIHDSDGSFYSVWFGLGGRPTSQTITNLEAQQQYLLSLWLRNISPSIGDCKWLKDERDETLLFLSSTSQVVENDFHIKKFLDVHALCKTRQGRRAVKGVQTLRYYRRWHRSWDRMM